MNTLVGRVDRHSRIMLLSLCMLAVVAMLPFALKPAFESGDFRWILLSAAGALVCLTLAVTMTVSLSRETAQLAQRRPRITEQPLRTKLHGLWHLIGEKYPDARNSMEETPDIRLFHDVKPERVPYYTVYEVRKGLEALERGDTERAWERFGTAQALAWVAGVGTMGRFARIDHTTRYEDDDF